jgi:phosphohistidine phosphatase
MGQQSYEATFKTQVKKCYIWQGCAWPPPGYAAVMNLYILRHGIAVERGTPGFKTDADRPLTPKGKRQLRQIAGAARSLDLDFDLILSSPFLRARQTAEIVAKNLKQERRLAFSDELTPDGSPKALIRQLSELEPAPENILLVGHEPYLSQLAALLISGGAAANLELKKGGLGKLETDALRFGRCATLQWLLAPKQMKLMV